MFGPMEGQVNQSIDRIEGSKRLTLVGKLDRPSLHIFKPETTCIPHQIRVNFDSGFYVFPNQTNLPRAAEALELIHLGNIPRRPIVVFQQ
jgi:hypothetical protein